MTTEVRQGLGLLCVALALLLVSVAAGENQVAVLIRGAGILCGIGSLALIAYGLLRRPS